MKILVQIVQTLPLRPCSWQVEEAGMKGGKPDEQVVSDAEAV